MSDTAWIKRLRDCVGDRNPPASAVDIRSIGGLIEAEPPRDLLTLYAAHDGSDTPLSVAGRRLPVRQMPLAEVRENAVFLAEFPNPTGKILWTWTDDNSNYAGVYCSGALRGMVAVRDHEEPDTSPKFRSTGAFVDGLLDACIHGQPAPVDAVMIPAQLPCVSIRDCAATDRDLATQFLERFAASADDDERRALAFVVLRLLPPSDMEKVIVFLHDEDMWIAERAVELVASRRWEPGIPHLGKLVEHGLPNAQSAACRCLHRWKQSKAAASEKQRLTQSLTGRARDDWERWRRWTSS